jgi:hypothetical protein
MLLGAVCLALPTPALSAPPAPTALPAPAPAPVARALASFDAAELAAWIAATGDAQGRPYLIVDKVGARVFAFEASGKALGTAPVLLGLGKGDVSPPGVGSRRLADIPPADRITPAGRFEASRGRNLEGKDILWVDYDAAISLHAVVTGTARERRLERLASPTTLDNRISYGCINVPAAFYESVVRPLFEMAAGIVYVLPEASSPAAPRVPSTRL